MKRIVITSDCTCDLSDKILEEYGIELIYFYIQMDKGCFKDTEEITATNVVEYFKDGGKKIITTSPDVDEIKQFYEKVLKKCDEIIHISVSSKLNDSYKYAVEASKSFEGNVHVIDSENVSTGLGQIVVNAAELVKSGKNSEEVVLEVEKLKKKVSSTFIMENLEGFYRTERIKYLARYIASALKIHPVIVLKNGKLSLKDVMVGDYERAVNKYVKRALGKTSSIDKKRVFITHTNVKVNMLTQIKQQVEEYCEFENVYITRASASITGNCGENTVAVIFVRK